MRNGSLAFVVALSLFAIAAFIRLSHRKSTELNTAARNNSNFEISVAIAPAGKVAFPKTPSVPKENIISADYETLTDVDLLPDALKRFYGIGNNSPFSGMSNPGGVFNESDVTTDNKIPRMRLVIAAVSRSENLWIIHYEFGGYTHGYNVAVLTISGSLTQPIWLCRLTRPAANIDGLLGTMRSGACVAP